MSDPNVSPEDSKPAPKMGTCAGPDLIVGIGASAGGLGAFTSFLKEMPADNGMAFVLVQHLSPDHKSALVDLLSRATAMTVIEAADGTSVEANMVYVIPPNATLTIEDGALSLSRPAPPRERRRPIDTFFSSLAEDQGENAVCIILSGTGSDGTLGLKTVKENGGFALAQAEFDHSAMSGMPRSAAATGLVDDVLPVEAMPDRILAYRKHLEAMSGRKNAEGTRLDMADHLNAIKRLLRAKTGHDFSGYKDSTVTRRIQRRMQVLQIAEVPDYVARLSSEPAQIELLFRDLLIGVTRFFRDPAAFAALETLIPKLFDGKSANDQFRVWVPGCATGEEVYSIAFLIREQMEQRGVALKVQIFGTDIDDAAVAVARSARYRKLAGISPERVERWFVEDGEDYCPVKSVREMCVFSNHSVVKDPPFSRLDLISCRNLLIYMDADLQDRVLRTFHYALRADGVLFLGPSEGVAHFTHSFAALDKKHRIFQRRNEGLSERGDFIPVAASERTHPQEPSVSLRFPSIDERVDRAARRALEKFSPAYLIVNEGEEILRFSGSEAGHYLEPISGAASLNLYALLKKPLRSVVRDGVREADKEGVPVLREPVVIRVDGTPRAVSVIVVQIPQRKSGPKLYVVGFRDTGLPGAGDTEASGERGVAHANAEALEHELRTTRIQLQSAIDEMETSNEEMKSATEEYQSVNEELQSANEELETSREEMQSINEELLTVNAEMQVKNDMLTRANNDLKNLLDSTEIATIFLDNDLRIKSFTPGMTDIFHLRETDRGRPLTDLVSQVGLDDLRPDVRKVLRNLSVIEKEVQLPEKAMAFIMRMRPYRTLDNVIDGVVITFLDITEHKKAEDYRALLMGELDHRVKNILAIVSAVVTQTLKRSASPEDFAIAMEGRIAAIARAHGLLTQAGGRAMTSLQNLVTIELAPYQERENSPVILGPDVALTPKAGLTLGLAIHELASNAVKFGALSTPSGQLTVEWSIAAGGTSQTTLKFVWTEFGGPPPLPTARTGFGTILIERSLTQEFDAIVERKFLPAGLRCIISIPLTAEVGQLLTTA